jgi:hypothetical protein
MGLIKRQIELVFGKSEAEIEHRRPNGTVLVDIHAPCDCRFHRRGETFFWETACSPAHQSLYLGVNKIANEKLRA